MAKQRKLYSICIGLDPIQLRGWGKTPLEAIADLKKERLKECIDMALGFEDECRKDKGKIKRSFLAHLKDSDVTYEQYSWIYTVYYEVYCEERGEWTTTNQDYWVPDFPIELGV